MRDRKGAVLSVLVVDDAVDTLEIVRRNLTGLGYRVCTAPGVREAIEQLESTHIDLVITDLKMPKVGGLDLVRYVRENARDTEVMMITGYATIDGAVEAVRSGAEEYLPKPFTDEELRQAVARVVERLRERRAARPPRQPAPPPPFGILGESPSMQEVFRAIVRVASTTATVLVSGESGVGKELVARAIHYQGPRAAAPFVPINCGAIPRELFESELFGHVKGAFTGATESRAGFFQAGDGGTVFLDEVGELGLPMQVKLLRILQDHEVVMVGSERARRVDVRIIAATNKDLAALVKKGLFREDLFYRLSVITIAVPPLRERGNDILLLARRFAAKYAKGAGREAPHFADRAAKALKGYAWPGNVRELENLMNRLAVMTDGESIDVWDLPPHMRFSVARGDGFTRSLAEVEAEYVKNVFDSVGGNKSRAAAILKIDRKTLREKLKERAGT